MARGPMALARPAAGVVALLGVAAVASASPLFTSPAAPFLGAAASGHLVTATVGPPPAAPLMDAPVAPPPAAAAKGEEGAWDTDGAPPPSETAAPTVADAGVGVAETAEPADEPVWDDYGGGSPYPPLGAVVPELNDGGGGVTAELQDPPADASPTAPACAALGAVCHPLLRCCEEEEGVAACAVVPEGAEEHPMTGHCMRLVTG